MSRNRENEWAFFVILTNNDIWTILKKFMYINKKKSNIHNYRNGDIAAYYGYLELLKNNDSLVFTVNAMNWAAGCNHLEVIKWLHKNRSEGCNPYAMNSAADSGHLEVIKWLHTNRSEGCTTLAMDWAAKNGHLDITNWLNYNCH
jgi:hypothetical protein